MLRSSNPSSHLLPPYCPRSCPGILLPRQHFSTTPIFGADNHYETLNIPANASQAEIKGKFYQLSKAHHPDHNRNDPNASARFVKISEAYAILGSPQKREVYDRDLRRTSQSSASTWSSMRSHSGSGYRSTTTTGPAGGRPASGLSRRRGQFRGPPPSFYRSGGWGVHARKRQAAADATASAAAAAAAAGAAYSPGRESATRESQRDAAGNVFADDNDVPHFDRAGHFRTQQRQEAQRLRRLAQELQPAEPGHSMLTNFVFVGGILLVSFAVPSFLYGVFIGTPGVGRLP